jgi:hypothetical protein
MTTDSKIRGFRGVRWGRGLTVLGLLVAGGLMQGCIIETSSGPPAVCLDSAITFDWVITANGITRSCAQAGATTVSIRVDDNSMIADFACSALAGTTVPVTGGVRHTLDFQLTDSAGNVLSELNAVPFTTLCGGVSDVGNVEFSLTP